MGSRHPHDIQTYMQVTPIDVFKERKRTSANSLCYGFVPSMHLPELDFSLAAPLVLALTWEGRLLIRCHPLRDQGVDFIGNLDGPQ